MCTTTATKEKYYREQDIRNETNYNDYDDVTEIRAIQDQAQKMLKVDGIYAQHDFL